MSTPLFSSRKMAAYPAGIALVLLALAIPSAARAESPAAARQKNRQAQLEANQADLDLDAHLRSEPKDVQSNLLKQKDVIPAKIYALGADVTAAQKGVEIAKMDQGEMAKKVAAANQHFNDLKNQSSLAAENFKKAKDLWAQPQSGLVRDYDSHFASIKNSIPCEDLAEARNKIRNNDFFGSNDSRLVKLGIDMNDLKGQDSDRARAQLSQLQKELDARLAPVLANIDEAEKVKRELVGKYKMYPWSDEAKAARQSDGDLSHLKEEQKRLAGEMTKATSDASDLATQYGKLTAEVAKAQLKVKQAEDKQKAGKVALEKEDKDLQKKLDDSSKEFRQWNEKKLALEKRQAQTVEKMRQTKDAFDRAVEDANVYMGKAEQRWNVFKQKVFAKLAEVKAQIAATDDEDQKNDIRSTARDWFSNSRLLVPKFTAELEGSPFNDGSDETKRIRVLIADTQTVAGQIDSIVTALEAKLNQQAVDLSGSWRCACESDWVINRTGENTSQGARYAVRISNGDWSCSLGGSFDARTKVLTVAGKDSNQDRVTVTLTYNSRNGRLEGSYINRTNPRTDAEEVWRN